MANLDNTGLSEEENKRKVPKGAGWGIGYGIGIPIGLIFGILLDNIAIGIAIGVAIGAGIGGSIESGWKKNLLLMNKRNYKKYL